MGRRRIRFGERERRRDRLLRAGARQRQRHPDRHFRATNPQIALFKLDARLGIWRGANQIGKSAALAKDCVMEARRVHPYRSASRLRSRRYLVVGESWAEMDPLIEKIWDQLPADEISPRLRYVPGNGIKGHKQPVIELLRGPGAGARIHFATYRQGARRIAGGTYHGVWADEPLPESLLGELIPRVTRHHGIIRLGLTPTPESPPLEYLRELVDKGAKGEPGGFHEVQTSLSLDAVTPRGGLVEVPWLTAEELADVVASYLDVEREMRVHGSWEQLVKGRWISTYDPGKHLSAGVLLGGPDGPALGERIWIAVGIDHGAKAGRQAAELVACSEDGRRAWFLDEYRPDDRSSTEEDAKGIVAMLRRHGIRWDQIDYWVGDRAHAGDYFGNRKSNSDLLRALARVLRKPVQELRDNGLNIRTPKKLRGSVSRGCRLIRNLFRDGRAWVSLRCQALHEGLLKWCGADNELKDPIDAARYAIEELIDRRHLEVTVRATAHVY